jgi:hypothetical protein
MDREGILKKRGRKDCGKKEEGREKIEKRGRK